MAKLPRQLTDIEEYDIRSSFDVLDADREGIISFEQMHVLFSGLGYGRLGESEFRMLLRAASEDHEYNPKLPINLDVALKVFAMCQPIERRDTLKSWFGAFDDDNKGYITAEDVQRLSEQAGDPVSIEEAQNMVKATLQYHDAKSDDATKECVTKKLFKDIMSPRTFDN